jgi:diguanylate cyclase (GGDEF)-like protein
LAVFATQPIISIIQRLSQQRYLVTLTQNGRPVYTDINAQNQQHVNKHWIVVSHFVLQGVDYSIVLQLTETQLRQYRDKLPVIYVILGLVIAVLLLSVLHYIQAVKTQNQQLKQQKSELKELSARDSLTKVLNRRSLIDIIPKAMERAQRSGKKMAVLFIDLDDFKTVNDNCGHRIGDLVLIKVCNRLEHRLRKHDHLGRLGGDEFVMVLEGVESDDQVATIAKRQISLFNQPIIMGHQKFLQTVSIGIAIFPDDSTDPEDLLLQADAAMYASKRMGKKQLLIL